MGAPVTIGHTGITVFSTGGGAAAGYPAPLLETGQKTPYAFRDDGGMRLGVVKAYLVVATAGTSDIEVAHYAGNGLSFTAPNTVSDAAAGLVTFLNSDRIRIKGSLFNDGEYNILAGGVAGSFTTVENTIVNELAGAVVSLYKVAALSNNTVKDLNTGREWARYTSSGLRVGVLSTGLLNWYDILTRWAIYNAANTISVVAADVIRVVGGAALTQFRQGDCIQCAGFVNPINNLAMAVVLAATPSGPNLDITVDTGNEVLVVEGAVGDTAYLNTRSIYNFCAGANLVGAGGYSDWRVANLTEFQSLKDCEAPTAVPDAVAFPGWPVTCWSSTTAPNVVDQAQFAYFNNAGGDIITKTWAIATALVRN